MFQPSLAKSSSSPEVPSIQSLPCVPTMRENCAKVVEPPSRKSEPPSCALSPMMYSTPL
jgi:hypothetical protein